MFAVPLREAQRSEKMWSTISRSLISCLRINPLKKQPFR
jgi:hypothetical protein